MKRLRLYDKYYNLLWDSDADATPPYQHISDYVNATIDTPNFRWSGILERRREGIVREPLLDLQPLLEWPKWT